MSELTGAAVVRRVGARRDRLGWLATSVGALVTFGAVGFLIPLFIDVDDRGRLALINGPAIVVYVLLTGLLVGRRAGRRARGRLAWIEQEREPTPEEHRRTLGLAAHVTQVDALSWLGAAVLFAVLNGFLESWGFAAVVGATIWAGGETTCAFTYLATERILRPVTARALAVRPAEEAIAPGVRTRLVAAWLLGTGVPLIGVLVVGVVGLAKPGVDIAYLAAAVVFLAVLATGAGLLVLLYAARAIAHPITSVRAGIEGIERGELEVRVAVDDGSEIGLLQAGFNRMAAGLRERERIRDLFGRQVGVDVARAALERGTRLGGEEREVGALFGAPVPCEDPAGGALRAARALAARVSRDLPSIDFGIGISAGVAVAGNVGAEHRFEYTVIGDPVNEAARLAELAKERPDRVLASHAALDRAGAGERAAWSVTDATVLRGRGVPTDVAHPRG